MMVKKRKLPWIWIVIAVILVVAILFVLFKGNVFEKKTMNQQEAPQQKPCTANITLSCSDGSVITTQECVNGILVNTGKVCPCIANVTVTCHDGSVIITQECVNRTFVNTGKICPCFADNLQTCYNGSKVIIQNCVNGTLINTENACPAPPVPVYVPVSLTVQRLQALFQKSEYFTKLPGNAAILLTFFDGNGAMRNEEFFISSGGNVSGFSNQNYDLEFTMGDYRIPELESSSDFCAALNNAKNQQELENMFI